MGTSHCFHRTGRLVALLFLFGLSLAAQAAPRPHFDITDLGTLGGENVVAHAVNNRGDVVGQGRDSSGVFRGFLYRDGVMTQLPIGEAGYLFFINDSGQIVAQGSRDGYYRPYFISSNTVIDLNAQTGLDLTPVGINNSGVIAANTLREAITWSNGVVRYLDPDHRAGARDINNHGDVLGTFHLETPPGPNFFTALMHDGTLTMLGAGFLGETLNDHGHVAGTSYFGGRHAVLFRDGELLNLDMLPGDFFSSAWKINNAGQIIGDSEDGDDHGRPFFYTDGRMYSLRDLIRPNSGWTISYATDINDRGQIVGTGSYQGQHRAFLMTPTKKLR